MKSTINRTLDIAWKELLHMRKDRVLLPFLVIGFLLELTFVAWATSQPIDNLNMAVVDLDQSEQSAALVAALDATDTLTLRHEVADEATAIEAMDQVNTVLTPHANTILTLVIPAGFGDTLTSGGQPDVRIILNGAESVSAREARRVAEQTILEQGMRVRFNMEPADYEDQLPQVTVKYNEDLERSWYTLPGEAALIFYMVTMALAALAISREREWGTYEQLRVMPFRSVEVILGKALSPMLVGYVLFLSVLALMTLVFGVPLRGSLPLLLIVAVLYLLAEMGKGVLLSMMARTQLQAVLLVFVLVMVDLIFSGYAVAVETLPQLVQTIANFIPIRHWLVILRGVMLKNAGLDVLWPHIVALIAIGAVIIIFTAWQYRRNAS
ncbi:MAG: ABC transporter permease [Anaerolineaceae bacterium]|nr:ABC transporter permease [Anaerolineaceae bacterium]